MIKHVLIMELLLLIGNYIVKEGLVERQYVKMGKVVCSQLVFHTQRTQRTVSSILFNFRHYLH